MSVVVGYTCRITGNASTKIRKEIIDALHHSEDRSRLSEPTKIDPFFEDNFSKDGILKYIFYLYN